MSKTICNLVDLFQKANLGGQWPLVSREQLKREVFLIHCVRVDIKTESNIIRLVFRHKISGASQNVNKCCMRQVLTQHRLHAAGIISADIVSFYSLIKLSPWKMLVDARSLNRCIARTERPNQILLHSLANPVKKKKNVIHHKYKKRLICFHPLHRLRKLNDLLV